MYPDPVADISRCDAPVNAGHTKLLQELATSLPDLVKTGRVRSALKEMPVIDFTGLQNDSDGRIVERAFQIYVHFANVYVWCDQDDPADHIPPSVAVPLTM